MPSRRRFLATAAATGSAALAGCSSVPFVGGDGDTAAEPSDDLPDVGERVDSDWPRARRDAAHTACAPDAPPISDPSVAWRSAPVPRRTRPTVAAATVVCGAGGLRGIDVVSGDDLWKSDYGTGAFAAPVSHDIAYAQTETIETRELPGVVAVDAVSGDQTGSVSLAEAPRLPPTHASEPGTMLVPTSSGVLGYDTGTGEKRWVRDVFGAHAAPIGFERDLAVAATEAGELYAYTASGRERWRTDLDDVPTTHPVVGQTRVYVGALDQTVALSRTDGGVAWRAPDTPATGALALDDGRLYVPHGRELVACSPKTGGVVWRAEFDSRVVAAPAVGGDTVYVGTDDGTVHALAVDSGDERWGHSVGSALGPTLVVAGERLYAVADADNESRVVALS